MIHQVYIGNFDLNFEFLLEFLLLNFDKDFLNLRSKVFDFDYLVGIIVIRN